MDLVYLLPMGTMLVNIVLALYILSNNPKAILNRIYFLVTSSLVVWSFGDLMFFITRDPAHVVAWDNVTTISSAFAVAFLLHFFLVFSKHSVKKINWFVIYFFPSFFSLLAVFTHFISYGVKPAPWGYSTVPGELYIPFTFSVAIYVVIGIIICFQRFLKTTSPLEKKQTLLLIAAESIPLIGGIVFEVIPVFLGYQLLPLTSTLSTGTAVVIAYTMIRHGLMIITPELAAENILQTMADYLVVLDATKSIRLVNNSCFHALGYQKQELDGQSYSILFSEDSFAKILQNQQCEITIKTKNGTALPVLVKKSILEIASSKESGLVLVLRDLTAMNMLIKNLQEAQQKLQTINTDLESKVNERTKELIDLKDNLEKMVLERTKQIAFSEKRFSQLAEDAGEWIWEVDRNGLYTFSNNVVKQILGYDPEEIVGKKYFYDLFLQENIEEVKKQIFEGMAQQKKYIHFPNTNLHKNGSIVFLETNASPIIDDKGVMVGYRGADTDVTERRKAEDELKKRALELEKINNLMVGRELKMMELKKVLESKLNGIS